MDLSEVIQEFKARVILLYGTRFRKLIFDGPHSGGEEAQIPLLVVLNGDLLLEREAKRLAEIVNDIQYTYGVLLSVLPVSASIDNHVYAPLCLDQERSWIIA